MSTRSALVDDPDGGVYCPSRCAHQLCQPDRSCRRRSKIATPVEISATGEIEATCLYSGQSAGLVDDIVPAGELVRRIGAEAEAALACAESMRRL